MHLPRRTTVTAAALALALTGSLAACSDDSADPGSGEIVEPAGAEPGVDQEPGVDPAEPGVDDEPVEDVADAPAIDVEPTPE